MSLPSPLMASETINVCFEPAANRSQELCLATYQAAFQPEPATRSLAGTPRSMALAPPASPGTNTPCRWKDPPPCSPNGRSPPQPRPPRRRLRRGPPQPRPRLHQQPRPRLRRQPRRPSRRLRRRPALCRHHRPLRLLLHQLPAPQPSPAGSPKGETLSPCRPQPPRKS